MKIKINLIVLLLSLFLIPNVSLASEIYYTNYFGVEMTESEYNNLLELGFIESEIYYMDLETFDNNKDIDGNLESESTNYYVSITRYDATGQLISSSDMQIPEEDYNGEMVLPYGYDGYIETVYKKLRTTISAAGSNYRYKVTLTWKQMPKIRSYDIIGIGLQEGKVGIAGDSVFNQTYCVNTSCTNTAAVNDRIYDNEGVGASFKLPSSTSITSMQQAFYIDVYKRSSAGTITSMYAYGDYAHAVKTISSGAACGYYVNPAGIILADSIKDYYDTIESADALWTGTW